MAPRGTGREIEALARALRDFLVERGIPILDKWEGIGPAGGI
ncbi:hypothetical protein L3i22_014370 [Actinoplanes sp. L3-i22]|nr:hypothetical protein L3i22_014370 [Actinoplanes sp. L3-i22]